MKKCKEIGMGEDWQCPKNDQNKDCKEDFENSTQASVHTRNSPPGNNFEANKTNTNSSDNIRKPTSSFENTTLPSMLTREKKGDVAPSTIVTIITLIALVIVGVVYGARRIITNRNGSGVESEGKRQSYFTTLISRTVSCH